MNLTEFIEKEKEDSNLFWRLSSGEHQSLLDQALDRIEELEKQMAGSVRLGTHIIRLHAKKRKKDEKVKILLIEFDNNGYMNQITIRNNDKFHERYSGYNDVKLTDENGNEIKLYSESCDSIAERGIKT